MYNFFHAYDPITATYNITLEWRVELDCTSNTVIEKFTATLEIVDQQGIMRELAEIRFFNNTLVSLVMVLKQLGKLNFDIKLVQIRDSYNM